MHWLVIAECYLVRVVCLESNKPQIHEQMLDKTTEFAWESSLSFSPILDLLECPTPESEEQPEASTHLGSIFKPGELYWWTEPTQSLMLPLTLQE